MDPMTVIPADCHRDPHRGRTDDRIAALTRVIDWAEEEAAALDAQDAGICLQLARLALQARRGQT